MPIIAGVQHEASDLQTPVMGAGQDILLIRHQLHSSSAPPILVFTTDVSQWRSTARDVKDPTRSLRIS